MAKAMQTRQRSSESSKPEEQQQEKTQVANENAQPELATAVPILQLLGQGIQKKDIDVLMGAGYHTVECISFAPVRVLAAIKGISEQKADLLKKVCRKSIALSFSYSLLLL